MCILQELAAKTGWLFSVLMGGMNDQGVLKLAA